MKRLLFLIPCLLFFNSALLAQYLPDGAKPVSHRPPGQFCFSGNPLFIVDSLETGFDALVLQKDKLEVPEMYSGTEVPEAFKDKAEHGFVMAKTVDNTRLHRLEEVLDHFEIPVKNRNLRVLLNKKPLDPALFLADMNDIEKIEVIKLDLVPDKVSWSLDPEEEYINISAASW